MMMASNFPLRLINPVEDAHQIAAQGEQMQHCSARDFCVGAEDQIMSMPISPNSLTMTAYFFAVVFYERMRLRRVVLPAPEIAVARSLEFFWDVLFLA